VVIEVSNLFTFSFRPDVMNLLQIVENHLGEIDHWPSFVLLFLFNDHPSNVQTGRREKVIACGNMSGIHTGVNRTWQSTGICV